MKVAVLIRSFDINAGGAERYCVELTKRLGKTHEVHVFTQHISHQPDNIAFHLVPQWVKKPRYLNQLLFSHLTKHATYGKFDIVHSHDMVTHANVYTLHVPCFKTKWVQAKGINKVLRWLSTLLSPRKIAYLLLEERQMKVLKNKRFISVSEYLSRNLVLNYPDLNQHITIAYPGINRTESRKPDTNISETKKHLKLTGEDFLLLLVANDPIKKGLYTILKALSTLNNHRIHIAIAGSWKHNRIDIPNALRSNVHFLGVVKDMSKLYHDSDALIHPTLVDTYGMSVLEAMSAELPVIVSNKSYCGISEHLNNTQALVLQNPQDAIELSNKINDLFSDRKLRSKLAHNGFEKAQTITWENTLQETLLAYNTVLKNQ